MKKLLLIAGAVCFSAGLYAQKAPSKVKMNVTEYSAPLFNVAENVPAQSPSLLSSQTVNQNSRGTNDISVINIGTSANAYGLYNGGRTALWADPILNSVAFVHRMAIPPGSGFIGHDISTDGGNTWTVDHQLYEPPATTAGARYPQGVIVNPLGNTNPDNAHLVTMSALLDGSNAGAGSWGGLAGTVSKLDGSIVSQQQWSTNGGFRNNVPDAMTVNPVTGDVFIVDKAMIDGLGNQYVDTLVITRGVVTGDAIEWDQTLFYAPVNAYGTSSSDPRIAFAPDGMTGFICTLSDNGEESHATGSALYPVLYKTTDGGITWNEDAMVVALGGPDGIPSIVNGLLDAQTWQDLWGDDAPDRDEVIYTTAFTQDLAIDANGNPVISVVIGVSGVHGSGATPYSILSASGLLGSYNIYSRDGGETWNGEKLGENLKQFRGEFGGADGISEDNRSQLTTTYDGTKMFFSWLDTEFDQAEDNTKPDIFCVGWDIASNMYTDVVNVTFLSDAWLQAYMGTASYFAFTSGDDYIVPFVYQAMAVVNNVTDPTKPVQYKYIPDFTFNQADFIRPSVKEVENSVAGSLRNYPNPAEKATTVEVTLVKSAKVSLEIHNILGQKVYEESARELSEGTHLFPINVSGFQAGVYTYSVIANGERSTSKMMVK